MSFHMKLEQTEEKILVILEGDLDINSSPELKETVIRAFAKSPKEIVFDFSQLDYLDSTGLGALMAIFKVAKKEGYTLRIRNAKKNVRKLFTITELDKEFIMEDPDADR